MERTTFRVEGWYSFALKEKPGPSCCVGSQLENQRCSAMRSTETVARRTSRDAQKDHYCRDTEPEGPTDQCNTAMRDSRNRRFRTTTRIILDGAYEVSIAFLFSFSFSSHP